MAVVALTAVLRCRSTLTAPQPVSLSDPYAGNVSFVLNSQGGSPGATSGNEGTNKFWFCDGGATYDYGDSAWAGPDVGSFTFDGVNDNIWADRSPDFVFGSADFIIEVVFKSNYYVVYDPRPLVDYYNPITYGYHPGIGWSLRINRFGQLQFFAGLPGAYVDNLIYTGTTNVDDATWRYAAAVRSAGVFHLYLATLGGSLVEEGTGTPLTASLGDYENSSLGIGWSTTFNYSIPSFKGHVSQVRITKNTARPGFALPTGPFPALYGVSGANLICTAKANPVAVGFLPTVLITTATGRAALPSLSMSTGISVGSSALGKAQFAQQNALLASIAAGAVAQGSLQNGSLLLAATQGVSRLSGGVTIPAPMAIGVRGVAATQAPLTTAFLPAAAFRSAANGQGSLTTGCPVLASCSSSPRLQPGLWTTVSPSGAAVASSRASVAVTSVVRTSAYLRARAVFGTALGTGSQLMFSSKGQARVLGRCSVDRYFDAHDQVYVWRKPPQVTILERNR